MIENPEIIGPLTGEIMQELAHYVGTMLARITATGIPPAFAIQVWRDGDPGLGVNHVSNAERPEALDALRTVLKNGSGSEGR